MARLSWRDRFAALGWFLKGQFDTAPGTVGDDLIRRIYPSRTGEPPKRGTTEFLRAYSTSPWLRAVESRISASIASVTWKLYTTRRKTAEKAYRDRTIQRAGLLERKSLLKEREKAGELSELSEHVFLTALDQGNPYLTGLSLRKLTQVYLDLVGESYWLKERNGAGAPIAFWPIPPDWIADTPVPGGPFFRLSHKGFNAEIPQTEIFWMCDPDPVNPYGRGSGQVMAVGDELDADEYAAKTQRQKFVNSARPDFLVYPKGNSTLSPAEVTRLELDWTNKHQGFWRQFKPKFLSAEVGVHEFDQDFNKLQLVELRQFERDMILQVTGGFSPELLGLVENSNRSTIDAAKYLMDTQVLIPRLEFQRACFQRFLINEYDERLIVDYESPATADPAQQLTIRTTVPYVFTVDELREFGGAPPKGDKSGQYHVMPIGVSHVETLDPPEDEPMDPNAIPAPEDAA